MEKELRISPKEFILTVPAILLCLPAFFDNALWVVLLCLGASWLIFMYACYAHVGKPLGRTMAAVAITAILVAVGGGVCLKKIGGDQESSARSYGRAEPSQGGPVELILPPTIHDYFAKDGNEGGSASVPVELKSPKLGWSLTIGVKMSFDRGSQAKFLSVFVPNIKDHPEACFDACASIPEHFDELVKKIDFLEMNTKNVGEDEVKSSEMILSRAMYIYYESEFSYEQLAYLEEKFASHKLRVQFRGEDYASIRWLQDEPGKASLPPPGKSKEKEER